MAFWPLAMPVLLCFRLHNAAGLAYAARPPPPSSMRTMQTAPAAAVLTCIEGMDPFVSGVMSEIVDYSCMLCTATAAAYHLPSADLCIMFERGGLVAAGGAGEVGVSAILLDIQRGPKASTTVLL